MSIRPFNPKLSSTRDEDILKHVFRMRLTNRAVLKKEFFDGTSDSAVDHVTRRHARKGYLKRYKRGPLTYFRLGRIARRHGLSRAHTDPLGPQMFLRNYAVLAFCYLNDDETVLRLLPEELKHHFSWFPAHFLGEPFYRDEANPAKPCLGQILVECTAEPYKVLKKHRRRLYRYKQIPDFRRLIESDRFIFATVTSTPERRDVLDMMFAEDPACPRFVVMDYPDLLYLPQTKESVNARRTPKT